MDPLGRAALDLSETFPVLTHAPIVEAVMEWRARAEAPWEEPALRQALVQRLPEYPTLQAQHLIEHQVTMEPGVSVDQRHRESWRGLRALSADKLYIAQFSRDGFLFSRLSPYPTWGRFRDEAVRVWRVYQEIACPSEIYRFAVRFINRVVIAASDLQAEKILQAPPQPPRNLALALQGYFHQDTWNVPGHDYTVIFRRTVQPSPVPGAAEADLILDIDVFTNQPFEPNAPLLEKRLAEMRWLKNKVFFESVTLDAVKLFQ